MAEPKPFASLSSGLLARKGAAKPAMRPQGFGQMGMGLEDLGWNDMGHSQQPAAPQPASREQSAPEHVPSSISALTPAPRNQGHAQPAEFSEAPAEPIAPPPVVEQQRAVAEAFAGKPEPQPKPRRSRASAPVRERSVVVRERSAPGAKAEAAFTLRLEPERHLKLRLACAVLHRSAQQIVTEALDQFLGSHPDIEVMAEQVPAKTGAPRG